MDRTNSRIFHITTTIRDLVILNLLFLLCCLPVFTAGASAAALYTCLFRMQEKKEGYISRDFFHAFKENFKKSTVIWLIFLAAGLVLYGDIRILSVLKEELLPLRVAIGVFFFIYLCFITYVFPLTAFFNNTVPGTLKNAFWMSMGYLPLTLSLLVIECLPVFLIYIRPQWEIAFLPFMLLLGVALQGYACTFIFRFIFGRYVTRVGADTSGRRKKNDIEAFAGNSMNRSVIEKDEEQNDDAE